MLGQQGGAKMKPITPHNKPTKACVWCHVVCVRDRAGRCKTCAIRRRMFLVSHVVPPHLADKVRRVHWHKVAVGPRVGWFYLRNHHTKKLTAYALVLTWNGIQALLKPYEVERHKQCKNEKS